MNCAACLQKIDLGESLKCCQCVSTYHYLCMNMSSSYFMANHLDLEQSWACPQCRSKVRRNNNDNTPTPTRAQHAKTLMPSLAATTHQNNNGNSLEKKKIDVPSDLDLSASQDGGFVNTNQRGSQTNCSTVEIEDSYHLEFIRETIRDELRTGINEILPPSIGKIIADQVETAVRNVFSKLLDKITSLEEKVPGLLDTPKETNKDVGPAVPNQPLLMVTPQSSLTELALPRVVTPKTPKPITSLPEAAAPQPSAEGQQQKTTTVSSAQPVNMVQKPTSKSKTKKNTKSVDANLTLLAATTLDAPEKPNMRATIGAEGEWTEVNRRRSRVVRGSAAPGTTLIEAHERTRFIHLCYVKAGTTAEQIHLHLKSISGLDAISVDPLKPRGNYASFKLGVSAKAYTSVMAPENWPEDIYIKPWTQPFRKKRQETPSQN